jgi:hypothetical protein
MSKIGNLELSILAWLESGRKIEDFAAAHAELLDPLRERSLSAAAIRELQAEGLLDDGKLTSKGKKRLDMTRAVEEAVGSGFPARSRS